MAPTNPKKPAKKSAARPPGKAASKKGVKAPFAKPHKAPAPKVKPESWTDDRLQAGSLRRKYSTAERREHRILESERKASTSTLKQKAVLAACGRREPMEWFDERVHTGSGVPFDHRFLIEATLVKPGCPTPRFSPQYEDDVPHGEFNPNAVFSPTNDEKRQQGNSEDGVAFSGRKGPLQFEGGAGNPFDEMRGPQSRQRSACSTDQQRLRKRRHRR